MSSADSASGDLSSVTHASDLLVLHGCLVFFQQVGFVSLELGYGRSKNVRNVLLKNTINILLSAVCWWAVGYAFGYGDSAAGFIGSSSFFDAGSVHGAKPWFYSWTFAISTVTITSGCLAERTSLVAYPVLTVLMTLLVHPLAAHWAWNKDSWLMTMRSDCEFLDFAGGTVVHVCGGLMGLIGAAFVGPRIGRFEDGAAKDMPGHDVASVSLGTLFLFFGWFGFNGGSTYLYLSHGAFSTDVTDRVALNMTLSASTSGLVSLLVSSIRTGTVDLCICCNALLAGLVMSTPACGFIAPWAAVVYGLVSGLWYLLGSKLLLKLQIDDPLESSAIHFGSGVLGTVLLAFLARPAYVRSLTGADCGGIVYGHRGGVLLGMQLLGTVVIAAWTAVFSSIAFWALRRLGHLRVDQVTELAGLDNMAHGGPAYPEFNLVQYTANSER